MADKTVDIELRVKTAGMDQAEKQSAAIANNMAKANKAGAPAAARPGAAAINSAVPGESKTARSLGAGAGTGSAASDFAAQASGLGGLVHVYATFAANVFAVSAAFNALSKAMDVTNLVKGLDQIGASSGKNLGSLAKQMVTIADGAISMQQAMRSTAMATSSGMTNDQVLRMTKVAQQASLALGRDLPDSMDRLTKGIVKSQPELLDELGIMTRMIPAQQEYARQIGKTVGSLTTFEKQQAFANAVLTEGEKKFKAIEMQSNPYTKILSSTQNLLQSGLEVINKVLGPLVDLLAKNPIALGAALTGIASILLKQAVPAIGMFRENARKMSEEATALANRRMADAKTSALGLLEQNKKAALEAAAEEQKILTASLAKLDKIRATTKIGKDTKSFEILNKDALLVTEEELKHLDNQAAGLLKKGNAIAAQRFTEVVENITLTRTAYNDVNAAQEAYLKGVAKQSGYFSQLSITQRIADKANQEATRNRISNIWAENTHLEGFFKASQKGWKELWAAKKGYTDAEGNNIKGITNSQVVISGVSNTIKSAASGVMTLMSSLSNVMMVIGVVVTAFEILDNIWSKSAKEAAAFADSIDNVNTSLANADRTLEVISKKDIKDFLSIESLQAKSTALNDLTSTLTVTIEKFNKLKIAQSGWDSMWDSVFSWFGKGASDKLDNSISKSIVDALKLVESGPAKTAAMKTLHELLGAEVDLSNFTAIEKALDKLDEATKNNVLAKLPELLQAVSRTTGNSATALTSFATALSDTGKQITTLSNSLIPTDNYSKLGMEIAKESSSMAEAMKNGPIDSLLALQKLAGDMQSLSILPGDWGVKLGAAKKDIDNLQASLSKLTSERDKAQEDINVNTAIISKNGGPVADKRGLNAQDYTKKDQETRSAELALRNAQEIVAIKNKQLQEAEASAAKIKADFSSIPEHMAQESFKLLAKGLSVAMNEAAINSARGFLGIMQQAGSDVSVEMIELSKKQIDGQIAAIRANFNLVESNARLTAAVERATLFAEQANLQEQNKVPDLGLSTKEVLRSKLIENQKAIDVNTEKQKIINTGGKQAQIDASKGIASPATLAAMKDMQGYMTSLFGMWGQIAGKNSEQYVLNLQKAAAQEAAVYTESNKQLALEDKRLNNAMGLLEVQKNASVVMSDDLLNAYTKNMLDSTNVKIKEEENNINIKLAYANTAMIDSASRIHDKNKEIRDTANAQFDKSYETSELLKADLKVVGEKLRQENEIKTAILLRQQLLAKINRDYAIEVSLASKLQKLEDNALAIKESELDLANSLITLTVSQTAELEKQKETSKAKTEYDRKSSELLREYLKEAASLDDTASDFGERWKKLWSDYKSAAELAGSSLETSLTLANNKALSTIQKDWKQKYDEISSGLADAILNAGKDGGASLWEYVYQELVSKPMKILVQAIISPVSGMMSAASTGLTNGLMSGMMGNAGGSMLGNAALTATMADFGTAAMYGTKAMMGITTAADAAAMGIATSTSPIMTSIAAWAGPALAVVGGLMVLKNLGVFGSNFTSAENTGGISKAYNSSGKLSATGAFDGSKKTPEGQKYFSDAVEGLSKAYFTSIKRYGGKALAFQAEYSGNTGREGANPNTVLGVNIGKASYSSGEISATDSAGLQLAASRAIITALKESELPKELAGVFDDITPATASQDQINAALTEADAIASFYKQLQNSPFENLNNQAYTTYKQLAEVAGGMENLTAMISNFYNTYYTAEERLVYSQKAVTKEMKSLGLSSITTKDQFRAFAENLDVTTEAGATLYAAMMKIAPAFASVADAADEIANNYFEAFATPAEKLSKKVTKLKSGLLALQDIGRNDFVAGPSSSLMQSSMEKIGLTSLKTAEDYDRLVTSLEGSTGSSKKLRDGLVALGPAFTEVYKEVAGIVKSVTDNIDSSIFNMEYGMKSDAGKYGMLDQQAADSNALMLAAGDKNDIYEIADYATQTIETVNKAWNLLSAEQQAASFSEYKATLLSIKDFVKAEGADPLSLQNARDKATGDIIATQVAAAVKEALAQSAADIKAAAENINTAADKPNVAVVNMNVNVSNPTKSEVGITWNDQ